MAYLDRLRTRWNRHQFGFILGLILPAVLGLAVLRGMRLASHGELGPIWMAPDLFRPMGLFWGGIAALGLAYLGLSDDDRANRQRLFFLQIVAVPVVVLEVLGHALFMSTGASLDANLLSRGILVLNNKPEILWSEDRPQYLVALGGLAATAVLLPWGVAVWFRREASTDLDSTSRGSRRLLILSIAAIGSSFLPSFATGDTWFSRPTTVNVTVSFVRDLQETWVPRTPVESSARKLELTRRDDGESSRPSHVAIIVLESLRARSTTVHEPDLKTTPYLAELAESSTVAERAYTVMPHTSKALVGMLCRVEPFLATYLTVTPHHPCTVPDRYEFQTFVEPADSRLNRYLNTIYYLDRFVEKLIDQYRELGLYGETLFVIAGDHGEAFGEHGYYHHDSVIYEEGMRTLLMVHDPTEVNPEDIENNVTHLDLVPTIADRLGFEPTSGVFRGHAMRDIPDDRPIYASCYFERRCMARLVGPHKYIHQFDKESDAFFDLEADPKERHNLLSTRDDIPTWRRDLLRWRSRVNAMYLADE